MKMGVIGGSGLYALFDPKEVSWEKIETPFGSPSDAYAVGKIQGQEVVFLPRHGRTHHLLPTEVNYQANIYGFKKLGVTRILSMSAVGSLKKELKPRDVVIVDQFFDRSNKRPQTFFGNGFVAHVGLGDPVCPDLRHHLITLSKELPGTFHPKGTYVNMEGPQFSTRAESNAYRHLGFDVIGMTNMSEARLAREAEICYATLAFVTDYDCWHTEEDSVTTDAVLKVLHDNAEKFKQIVACAVEHLGKQKTFSCTCQEALQKSRITPMDKIPPATLTRLKVILKKYVPV
jgi:5'-methylthioadenosine phosphorylase